MKSTVLDDNLVLHPLLPIIETARFAPFISTLLRHAIVGDQFHYVIVNDVFVIM